MIDGADRVERPFRGLRYFDEPDSHLFFGRDEQIDDLVASLRRSRFVAVIGSSGSGKSSLVRAGLVPGLRAGYFVEAGGDWRVVVTRPGNAPIDNLGASLAHSLPVTDVEVTLRRGPLGLVELVQQARLADGEQLLVIVDQFEELFRYQREHASTTTAADESAFLVKLLLDAAAQRELPIYVVLTLRSDFLGNCAQFRDLPERLNEGLYLVPRMRRDQIRDAITGPLGVVGVQIVPGLVQRLLNDVGDDPDQLPVLQHALMRTWRHWVAGGSAGAIDLPHYEATGALERSLSDHATEVYESLPAAGRRIAKVLFQRLIDRDAENREVRRRATIGEVASVAGVPESEVAAVADAFAADGVWLLMRQRDLLDVTHESLIRKWRLVQGSAEEKGWLQEEVEARDVLSELATRARRRRSDLDLLVGTDLERANAWRSAGLGWPWASRYLADEDTFRRTVSLVDDSREKSERQAREIAAAEQRAAEHRDRQRRRAYLVAGLAMAVTLVVAALAVVAWRFRAESVAQAAAIRVSTIVYGAAAVLPRDPTVAALVLDQARTDGAPWIATQVASTTAREALAAAVLRAEAGPVTASVFSPDGSRVATGFEDGSVRVWRADGTGLPLILRGHSRRIASLDFSPDGTRLASASRDETVRVWRSDGTGDAQVLNGHRGGALMARFSPDGTRLVTAIDAQLRAWRVGERLEPIDLALPYETEPAEDGFVSGLPIDSTHAISVTPIGIVLWCYDGSCEPRLAGDVVKGAGVTQPVEFMALSRDGGRLLTQDASGLLRLSCIDQGCQPSMLRPETDVQLMPLRQFPRPVPYDMSVDGTRVVVAEEHRLVAWRVRFPGTDPSDFQYRVADAEVRAVLFHPDGWRVLAVLTDGTARLFGPDGSVVFRGHRGALTSWSFNKDGSRLLTTSDDGTARLWLVNPLEPRLLADLPAPARMATFSRDGSRILSVAGGAGYVTNWSAQQTTRVTPENVPVSQALFSPDGASVLSVSDFRSQLSQLQGGAAPVALAEGESGGFSPDGSKVLLVWRDRAVRVWRTDMTSPPVVLSGHDDEITRAVFAPDSVRVATASKDKNVRIFAGDTTPPLVLQGHTEAVQDVAFSPDGKHVVSASEDRTARVWSVAPGASGSLILRGHNGPVTLAAFSPDGTHVLTASADATARVWLADGSGLPVRAGRPSRPDYARGVQPGRHPRGDRVGRRIGPGLGRDRTRRDSVALAPGGCRQLGGLQPGRTRVVTAAESGTRVWLVTLQPLLERLRGVTTMCLEPPDRRRFLIESPEAASAAYARCEQQHGRISPAPTAPR